MSKALIEAYMDAVWNKKQLEVIPRVVSSDAIIHAALGSFYGSKAMQYIVSSWLNGLPDLNLTIKHTIAERDLVAVHWQVKATHKGELLQIPASHNQISLNGTTIYRMTESMITEYWAYVDMYNLRVQLLAKKNDAS